MTSRRVWSGFWLALVWLAIIAVATDWLPLFVEALVWLLFGLVLIGRAGIAFAAILSGPGPKR